MNGDLDIKIDEMHHIMLLLRSSIAPSPILRSLPAVDPISPVGLPDAASRVRTLDKLLTPNESSDQSLIRRASYPRTPRLTPELSDSECSAQSPQSIHLHEKHSSIDPRESAIIPPEYQYYIKEHQGGSERDYQASNAFASSLPAMDTMATSPLDFQTSDRFLDMLSNSPPILPPPMIAIETERPGSMIGYGDYLESQSRRSKVYPQLGNSISITQHDQFKKTLYDNTVVLCEV